MSPFEQTATSGGGATEIPPAGTHPAVLVGIVDLGTHTEEFEDKDKAGNKTGKKRVVDVRRILLAWELVTEAMAGKKDTNHVATKDYSLSFTPKSGFRLMVEKWRGKAFADGEKFDPVKLLGQKCLVTIKHGKSAKGNDYANFDGVSPPIKGMTIPDAKSKPTTWTFKEGGAALAAIPWMPTYLYGEKIVDLISRSKEAQATMSSSMTTPSNDQTQPTGRHAAAAQILAGVGSADEVPF